MTDAQAVAAAAAAAAFCNDDDKLSTSGRHRRLAAFDDIAASLLSELVLLVSSTNDEGTLTLPGDFSNNRCDPGMSRILCVSICCFMLPCNRCSIHLLKKSSTRICGRKLPTATAIRGRYNDDKCGFQGTFENLFDVPLINVLKPLFINYKRSKDQKNVSLCKISY